MPETKHRFTGLPGEKKGNNEEQKVSVTKICRDQSLLRGTEKKEAGRWFKKGRVIAEQNAGAEDGTGDLIQCWSPPATADLPLARLNEKRE